MDIVEQLRSNADERFAVWQVVTTMNEAAEEIERLREALQQIACDCDRCCNENGLGCDNWTALSALQQKES